MKVEFETKSITIDGHSATLIEFAIGGDGIVTPISAAVAAEQVEDLNVDPSKGVILSGRGPTWLYGAMFARLHAAAWLAAFDPRLGAVVVASHIKDGPQVGDVVSCP